MKSQEGGLEHADSLIKWREPDVHLSRGTDSRRDTNDNYGSWGKKKKKIEV